MTSFTVLLPVNQEMKPSGFRMGISTHYLHGYMMRYQRKLKKNFDLPCFRDHLLPERSGFRLVIVFIAVFLLIPGRKNPQATLSEIHDTLNLRGAYDASYAGDAIFNEYSNVYNMLENPNLENEVTVSFRTVNDDRITDEDIADYLKDQDLDTEVLAQL